MTKKKMQRIMDAMANTIEHLTDEMSFVTMLLEKSNKAIEDSKTQITELTSKVYEQAVMIEKRDNEIHAQNKIIEKWGVK